MKPGLLVYGIVLAIVGSARVPCTWALDQDAAVELSREYLASENRAERQDLLVKLAAYEGEIDPVLRSLGKQTYRPVKPGYYGEERFTSAEFRKKHPEDLLYFVVPKDYQVDRPSGLIVFLHGGGATTSPRAPQATLRFPEKDTPRYSSRSGDMLAATGMITVGPSAPWNRESSYRWCLRGVDEYLADVILECKSRFNIDANRVFLLGHSMGGFGAYHQALRQPDRYAAIVDSWRLEHRESNHRGAMIDAVNRGDNTITVTTRNVARFTVWLHPRMVNVSKRVVVKVDDTVRFDGRVKPSLATALQSYERKRDWGMIYPIKIEFEMSQFFSER